MKTMILPESTKAPTEFQTQFSPSLLFRGYTGGEKIQLKLSNILERFFRWFKNRVHTLKKVRVYGDIS